MLKRIEHRRNMGMHYAPTSMQCPVPCTWAGLRSSGNEGHAQQAGRRMHTNAPTARAPPLPAATAAPTLPSAGDAAAPGPRAA
jgi:hypothetical protein